MSSQEIYEQLKNLWGTFDENHNKEGNKSAKGRARKALGDMKKLVTDYRKASVTESK